MKIINIVLFIIAIIMCLPIIFLIGGSLMGQGELTEYLGPVLGNSKGFATLEFNAFISNLTCIC